MDADERREIINEALTAKRNYLEGRSHLPYQVGIMHDHTYVAKLGNRRKEWQVTFWSNRIEVKIF